MTHESAEILAATLTVAVFFFSAWAASHIAIAIYDYCTRQK